MEDPERPTCRLHPEFRPDVRSYHIALSKKRSGTRIGKPRHVVFYTIEYEEVVFVMRIIKDDMDSRRHLDDFL
ncbi:MAG: type II toxin-antitoxin system RelE/ParE family toxin [Candidatus Hydrogenedentes bacterium]|nr:type II toxin-antitoxin system RelE/ParE family toxin [Candidatus Hydrogenedentota bacterium]